MSKNQGVAISGAIIGGLLGGIPGAIIGGILGSALQELATCPRCGSGMSYENSSLPHLSEWVCKVCGFRRK